MASGPAKRPIDDQRRGGDPVSGATDMTGQKDETAAANALFARPWTFLRGVPSLDLLPPEGPPEIAFAGRSNVGKSTLINVLTLQKGLARTSNTPGRTQELNIFVPAGYSGQADDMPPLAIVDMPGYGFAKAPKRKVEAWTRLVFDYLRGRTSLRRVFVLIDARHGVKANDAAVFDLLDKAAVSYQAVLTKTDKVKPPALRAVEEETAAALARRPAAFPQILATSSETGQGIDALRQAVRFAIDPMTSGAGL